MSPVRDPSDWVDFAAHQRPQQLFLATPDGRRVTYAALREESGRFAAALTCCGVGPGDRVAVQIEKSPEAVLLYVACLRVGAVFVPINVANTAREVDYFLRDSQPRLAVIRPVDRAAIESLARAAGVERVESLGAEGDGSLAALARQCDTEWRPTLTLEPNSPAAIVYTSGTTGRSKGAVLSRSNLASNAEVLLDAWRFTSRDVLLHTLPLFHVHGLFAAINTVLASAASMLLLSKFDAAQTLKHLPGATVYMGVPTHYTRLLRETALNRESTVKMRLFISGSAPLLADTHEEFLRRTGHLILERYGMTETLMNTSNPYDGARKPGSVGMPLPGIALRLARGNARPVEAAEDVTGGLEITGPNVFSGYWLDPEKTRSEFTADGWFKTGDLARIDSDGYVYIVGRVKDLVISGGFNVYPKEIEAELDALPGVLESAVFGVPHPDFGEGVTAVLVPRPEAALIETDLIHTLQTRLARYKIPKRVVLIDELPRNSMGKVLKSVLRQRYAALYSNESK